jgi:uncharacterized membrane protein (UPF0127 family)
MPSPRGTLPVRLVHDPADGDPSPLATSVETADTVLARARGLMFRRSVTDDYALVFQFGRPATRGLHMLFVPFAIDAVWLVGGEVQRVERLPAWRGHGRARADTVVELPAGAADEVAVGDTVRVAHEP